MTPPNPQITDVAREAAEKEYHFENDGLPLGHFVQQLLDAKSETLEKEIAEMRRFCSETGHQNTALIWQRVKTEEERDQLRQQLTEAKEKNEELEALFDIQHKCMCEAIKIWHSAHPDKQNVIPDLGALLEWLLSKLTSAQAAIEPFKVALEASYQAHHHVVKCPDCITALMAGTNLCDKHRTLVVDMVNKRDQALSPNCGQPLLELMNHIKQHTTHPQIDVDYYEWLNTADKAFMQKMITEKSAHGIAMYAFQAARTLLKTKASQLGF